MDIDPSDLSSIYFHQIHDIKPYVGSIEVIADERKVLHGRGVVALRDIKPGECLFVIPPTVAADVAKVRKQYYDMSKEDSLEIITEKNLIDEMKLAIEQKNNQIISSFLCLMGTRKVSNEVSMDVLLGKNVSVSNMPHEVSVEHLLEIVRKNAFGPDSRVTYNYIDTRWRIDKTYLPPRLLGLYPLAAMLNHSCQANAVRVYSGDIMVVHACAPIKQGEEIVWSYIPPTQPLNDRRRCIESVHGFVCQCRRCQDEEAAYNGPVGSLLHKLDSVVTGINTRSSDVLDLRRIRLAIRMAEEKSCLEANFLIQIDDI